MPPGFTGDHSGGGVHAVLVTELGRAVSWGQLLAGTLVGTGSAGALTSTSQPHLTLNRLIRTTPFVGSSVKVRDNEDTAYVAE